MWYREKCSQRWRGGVGGWGGEVGGFALVRIASCHLRVELSLTLKPRVIRLIERHLVMHYSAINYGRVSKTLFQNVILI